MSTSRPRIGLAKPREIDKELREVSWRATGSAISSSDDKSVKLRQAQWSMAAHAWGADPVKAAKASQINEFAEMLLQASIATGEDEDVGEFRMALEKLRLLGLAGPDGIEKLRTMLPIADTDRGLVDFIDNYDGSQQDALEVAAIKFSVPASSFAGAVQFLKRELMRVRKVLHTGRTRGS